MKVLITAHTSDEHGCHFPGDEIELGEAEARNYAEKQWGLIIPELIRAEDPAPIETAAMDGAPETTVGRRQRK